MLVSRNLLLCATAVCAHTPTSQRNHMPKNRHKSSLGRRHLFGGCAESERPTLFLLHCYSTTPRGYQKKGKKKENWNTSACQCMWEKMKGMGGIGGGRSITEWDLILVYINIPPEEKERRQEEEKREGCRGYKNISRAILSACMAYSFVYRTLLDRQTDRPASSIPSVFRRASDRRKRFRIKS